MTERIASRIRSFRSSQSIADQSSFSLGLVVSDGEVITKRQLRSFATFPLDLPHDFPDGRRIVAQECAKLHVQAVELVLDTVKSLLYPVKPGFHGCEIIAVAARLFEDMSRHQLLALDLMLKYTDARIEFFSCHVCRHETAPRRNLQINFSISCGRVQLLL
jgi:hypothetical protein